MEKSQTNLAKFIEQPNVGMYLDSLPIIMFYQDLIFTALEFCLSKAGLSPSDMQQYADKIIQVAREECQERRLSFGAGCSNADDIVRSLKKDLDKLVQTLPRAACEGVVFVTSADEETEESGDDDGCAQQ